MIASLPISCLVPCAVNRKASELLHCRPGKDCSIAAAAGGSARPVPRSLAGPGALQRPGQGPVTRAVFKMGHEGCLEVHVSNHPPLRDALQQ